MATVFKAYQSSLDRYVAVKVMPPYYAEHDDTFLKRFRREAKAIASLRHPNILIVIDYGEENDTTYIVMEFVEAGTLTELLGKPMAPEPMRGLIDQLAGALQYAHEQGVVHRDIKPSNILLPKTDWPLLTDFGLAKMVGGSQLTLTGTIAGTPAYMSPEQGRGEKVDSRTDIYSLGIVLYEMATGVVPFHAETPMAVVVKHIIDPLPLPRSKNPELPEQIERVILKALSKEPADRFQEAGELAKALNEVVEGLPAEVAAATPPVPVGVTTTIEVADDVDAAAQAAAAQQIAEGLKGSEVEPAPTRETGGFLSGRGRIAAAVAGGLLIVAVVAIGAAQLFGGATEDLGDSRTQDQLVADARAALEGDDPSAGLEDLDRAIENDPENVDLLFERARALAAAGEFDIAYESILQGIEVMPEEAWVHENAANTLWELGLIDEAIAEYRRALELDPQAYWLYSRMAEIYRETGRPDEAAAVLFEALENPSLAADPDELDSIGWSFLSLEMVNEAEAAFNRALEADPDNPSRYEGLAEAAYWRNGAPAGIEMVEAGIQRFPEYAPFYESAGRWQWEMGDVNQAALAFNQAIELDPTNSSAYRALANLLADLGRQAEGEELMLRGLEQNPNNPGFYLDAADFYMRIGETREAIPLLERVIEMEPEDGWFYAGLAQAYADVGDHDRARQLLGDASARNREDPWLDEFIGWTYLDLGDCDRAIDHFERALSMDPSIDSAEQGIRKCGG
jgi:tetratricopeptide (TPR) repeat protein